MAQDGARELFADGILGVSITGSVVRIDFACHRIEAPPAEGAGAPRPPLEFRQRVVMPLDGFAHTFGLMEQVMRRLVEDSQKRRAAAPAGAQAGSPAQASKPIVAPPPPGDGAPPTAAPNGSKPGGR